MFQGCWLICYQIIQSRLVSPCFIDATTFYQHATGSMLLQTYLKSALTSSALLYLPAWSEVCSLVWNEFIPSGWSWWSLITVTPSTLIQPIVDTLQSHLHLMMVNLTWLKLFQTLVILHQCYLHPFTTLLMHAFKLVTFVLHKTSLLVRTVVYNPLWLQDVSHEVQTIQHIIQQLNRT